MIEKFFVFRCHYTHGHNIRCELAAGVYAKTVKTARKRMCKVFYWKFYGAKGYCQCHNWHINNLPPLTKENKNDLLL